MKMTAAQKQKYKSWIDNAYKVVVTGILTYFLITLPSVVAEIRLVTYDSPRQKFEFEQNMNRLPSVLEVYQTQEKADSLVRAYAQERELERKGQAQRDTLIKRNAFTIYQMKENSERFQSEQRKVNKEILDKLRSNE